MYDEQIRKVEEKTDDEGTKEYVVDSNDDDSMVKSTKEDDNFRSKSEKVLSMLKETKLSKCKIINESDSCYIISQSVLNSKGFLVNPFGAVVVYTDGACNNNGQQGAKAGIGVWFNFNHTLNISAPVRGRATNNNAEIQAATAAILQASTVDIRTLHIYTDSQFLINCITKWIYKWKKNDWKNGNKRPVINKIELVELENSINTYMDSVTWSFVKAHSDVVGNTAADELAKQGALEYKPE
ncbi:ribonuclease H-like [Lycorma delicatula]|uniref:ribonuclease H-like n=1 Tax=Lycorma delicatula TaxID=130591 RepID=UPI003F5112F3